MRVIRFRRNFGKTPALVAGFQKARGEIVFTMDADLQDDPAEIPAFLEKLAEGYDLVSGWKYPRHDPITKTLPSLLLQPHGASATTGVKLHDMNCGFKAYRHEILDDIKLYGELHRFIPVLAQQRGFRVDRGEGTPPQAQVRQVEVRRAALLPRLPRPADGALPDELSAHAAAPLRHASASC